MPAPRPFDQETADRICDLIAHSENGLYRLWEENKDWMPSPPTLYKWLDGDADFVKQYARARERQADFMAQKILDIADDTARDTLVDDEGNERMNTEWVTRSRLRVDARKWLSSKLAPKKYGDKLDVVSDGEKILFNVTLPKPDADSGH